MTLPLEEHTSEHEEGCAALFAWKLSLCFKQKLQPSLQCGCAGMRGVQDAKLQSLQAPVPASVVLVWLCDTSISASGSTYIWK